MAVCTSERGGLPKFERVYAEIGTHGLVGDFHNRELRPSFSKPGTCKPNTDRHISMVAHEVLFELNHDESLGDLELQAGYLGENIVTRGLGDLSDLAPGTLLRIDGSVLLRVVEQNNPCENLRSIHRLLAKKIYGRRGIMCAIERGVGERIFPDDLIEVLPVQERVLGAA